MLCASTLRPSLRSHSGPRLTVRALSAGPPVANEKFMLHATLTNPHLNKFEATVTFHVEHDPKRSYEVCPSHYSAFANVLLVFLAGASDGEWPALRSLSPISWSFTQERILPCLRPML